MHDDTVDLEAGARASSVFFGQTYTNCTPWAIVATIGFADVIWHQIRATMATRAEELGIPVGEEALQGAPLGDTTATAANDDLHRTSTASPDLPQVHQTDLEGVLESAFEGPKAAAMHEMLTDAVVSAFDQTKGNKRSVSMRRFAKRFFHVAAAASASAANNCSKEPPGASSSGCSTDDSSSSSGNKSNDEAPKPMEVQVALYAQGLRYHNSHARRSGSSGSSESHENSGSNTDAALGLAGLGRAGAVLRALAAEERKKVCACMYSCTWFLQLDRSKLYSAGTSPPFS